jgi:hypothetical protein
LASVLGLLAGIVYLIRPGFLGPILYPNALRGDFLNAAAVPGPEGHHLLWILADGSFHYIMRVETPGRVSVGRKCRFCKTWTFVYDPEAKKVLARFKTDYRSIIIQSWMAHVNGRIWIATDAYDKNEPRVFVYSTDPAAPFRETEDLIKRYPDLGSGLIKVRMAKDPDRLILDTKDGRVGLVLTLAEERLYADESELRKATAADEEQVTIFALGQPESGPRRELFKVTGEAGKVKSGSLEYLLRSPNAHALSHRVAAVEPAARGCVYIEGLIVYQDADGCLILHQDAAGKLAGRRLTRIGADGTEKWTAGPAELFKEMAVDVDKNPLSQITFLKNELDVSRSGSLVLLQLKGVGLSGFDWATGRKLWEIRP